MGYSLGAVAPALRAATSAAADLCDLGNRGRIVKGAVADFLMVNGNPVADIEMAADKGNHRFVIKEGVVVAGNSGTVLSG